MIRRGVRCSWIVSVDISQRIWALILAMYWTLFALFYSVSIPFISESMAKITTQHIWRLYSLFSTAVPCRNSDSFFWNAHLNLTFSFLMNLAYLAVMPTVVALYVSGKNMQKIIPRLHGAQLFIRWNRPWLQFLHFLLLTNTLEIHGAFGGTLILFGLIVSDNRTSFYACENG